ncbi:hypothetical protein PPACK8108_LOCUS12288, partial [Phakopsora pachyrhizi]
RHGKNNTASSVFTHAERMMTGNGSKKQRFTSHSMADFDSCRLCLNTARDPRVDSEGHLFCHECILEHILNQKKDLKRQKALLEKLNHEEQLQRQEVLKSVRARVLEDFERTQSGITLPMSNPSEGPARALKSNDNPSLSSSSAPGFDQITTEAERSALEAIERESIEAKKSKLPNFWLPSLTPSAPPTRPSQASNRASVTNLRPLCNVSNRSGNNRPHPIKLSDLVTVRFDLDSNSDSKYKPKICSGCCKTLNKNSQLVVLKPCGDVICLKCFNGLVRVGKGEVIAVVGCRSQELCPRCDRYVDGRINLEREGTGFAAGGIAEATKFDVAFQG